MFRLYTCVEHKNLFVGTGMSRQWIMSTQVLGCCSIVTFSSNSEHTPPIPAVAGQPTSTTDQACGTSRMAKWLAVGTCTGAEPISDSLYRLINPLMWSEYPWYAFLVQYLLRNYCKYEKTINLKMKNDSINSCFGQESEGCRPRNINENKCSPLLPPSSEKPSNVSRNYES